MASYKYYAQFNIKTEDDMGIKLIPFIDLLSNSKQSTTGSERDQVGTEKHMIN